MKKKTIITAILLVLVAVVVITQFFPEVLSSAEADLTDMEAIYEFVQKEIVNISRDVFETWEMYYLDITDDGVDELVLVSPYGQHFHPYMEVIRVVDKRFQRIPSEIRLLKHGNIPEMRDGFLVVTSTGSGTGLYFSDMDLYLYDGAQILPSLLSVTLYRTDPLGEVTGELEGPLTDFTHTLMNIDPLRRIPVISRGEYHYRFDEDSNSFSVEQLSEAEDIPMYPFERPEINLTYEYDLDGSGMWDIFRLETHDEVRFVINDEVFSLPEIVSRSLNPYYELTRIEYTDRYAFVLYVSSPSLEAFETYFYEYTESHGLSLMGMVYSDESLYDLPILTLYDNRAVINYFVYPFFQGTHEDPWHVDSDIQWMVENTCANIAGQYNLQGFTNEDWYQDFVAYDEYVGVLIPQYDGVNKDLLTKQRFVLGTESHESVSFAIFGTMHDIEVFVYDIRDPETPQSHKMLGTLEDSVVTVSTDLLSDSSYIRVTGYVFGGEGYQNFVAFNLDTVSVQGDPIFIRY